MKRLIVTTAATAFAAASLASTAAFAHVSISSGPGFADKTQEITFGVGHGCAGADTFSIRVLIPAEVTSLRALRSDLGAPRIEKNATGVVTAVIWSKPTTDIVEGDPNYYRAALRLKVPNKPFTKLQFPTIQTCRTPAGVESITEWTGVPPTMAPDAGAGDAGAPAIEPAPELLILPARQPGWNKFTAPEAITDLAIYFSDAQIVWVGAAAFSPNATTTELIKTEPSAQPLTSIPAGAVAWVKY